MGAALDRRGFLLAVAGAATVAASARWLGPRPALARAAETDLAAARAATFAALARSLGDAPSGRFGVLDPAEAQRRFAAWYAAQDATVRSHADAVLDGVAQRAVPDYRPLAREASRCRDAAAAPRAAAVAAAVSIVEAVYEPPPAEDERPPVLALELAA